jgi:hypothetical protein
MGWAMKMLHLCYAALGFAVARWLFRREAMLIADPVDRFRSSALLLAGCRFTGRAESRCVPLRLRTPRFTCELVHSFGSNYQRFLAGHILISLVITILEAAAGSN